jgi:hypothetical protein
MAPLFDHLVGAGQQDRLSYGIQAAASPGLDELTFTARISAEEANHENAAAYFLECSFLHAARTGRRPPHSSRTRDQLHEG